MKSQQTILAFTLNCVLAFSAASPAVRDNPEFLINSTLIGSQEDAQVAFGAAGNFVVVWLDRDAAIFARRFDSTGIALGGEFRVSSTNPGQLFSPHVAPAADGSFVVIWFGREDFADEMTIFAQRFGPGGIPEGDELRIDSFTIENPYGLSSALASDSEGNFVLVWSDQNHVFARRFDSMGDPRGEEFVVNTTTGYPYEVAVARTAGGGFVVVWTSRDMHGSHWSVLARCYDGAGMPLGEEFRISANACNRSGPAVASDPTGGFVVAWEDDQGRMSGRRYDSWGRALGDEFVVANSVDGSPAIASAGAGGFLVAWKDRSYVGKHFSASGEPQGGRFRINVTDAQGNYPPPAVAGDGAGNYLVAYQRSVVEDQRGYDLFGRFLSAEERAGTLQFLPSYRSDHEGITDFMAVEGSTAKVTVIRSGGNQGDVTVKCVIDGGTATPGEDYEVAAPVMLAFPEGGGALQQFSVNLPEDNRLEGDETVFWRLTNPSGGALLAEPTTAVLTVVEDDLSEPGTRPTPRGPAFRVNTSQELDHDDPAVAIAPNGDFVVVWYSHELEGLSRGIFAQRYNRLGVALGSEFLVPSSGLLSSEPEVAFDRAGNFVVVWWNGSIGGRSFSNTGDPLGGDFVIAEEEGYNVRISPGPAGRFVVTWNVFGLGPCARIRQIELSGALYGDRYRFCYGHFPAAATAPSGDYLLTWEDSGVQALRFDSTGQPQGSAFQVSTTGMRPAITVDSAGTFTVAWENDYSYQDIFARRLSIDGEPRSDLIHVNTFPLGPQIYPQIASDAAGNFVVVWESGSWWQSGIGSKVSQDGSGSGVFGRRFNSSGMPVGSEFPIPTTTELNQQRPAIASHANGEFVVVWESQRADGGHDIMARLFSPNACVEDAVTLCLGDGRFRVRAIWRDFAGNTGQGRARKLTADTGYFWFFNPDNVEVVLKVLDGRLYNGHFWVFYGALSNVEYTLTVTDTQSGTTREYVNPLHRFASVGDITALLAQGEPTPAPGSRASASAAVDPASWWPRQGACVADATSLCLNQGRFRIAVDWQDFEGHTGVGFAEPLSGDTGYFWFFNEANVELVVKALDGIGVNGHYWIFYGALSNVAYTITVTDTVTDTTRTYFNPPGRFASAGDTMAFPGE